MSDQNVSYSYCTKCGCPLAEDAVYGEWDDLCFECDSEREEDEDGEE